MSDITTNFKPPMLSGTLIVPAHDCQYPPDAKANDLLRVDFDTRTVKADGLYLVEMLDPNGVAWRGCRRFQKMPHLHMDMSGDGKWSPFSIEAHSIRVVGYVEQVYKPA